MKKINRTIRNFNSKLAFFFQQMEREDEDFGEGYIAESHPLRPTHLTVPLGGRSNSRAPSISSSVSDLDVPIYTRETTVPLSARKVSFHRIKYFLLHTKLNSFLRIEARSSMLNVTNVTRVRNHALARNLSRDLNNEDFNSILILFISIILIIFFFLS